MPSTLNDFEMLANELCQCIIYLTIIFNRTHFIVAYLFERIIQFVWFMLAALAICVFNLNAAYRAALSSISSREACETAQITYVMIHNTKIFIKSKLKLIKPY